MATIVFALSTSFPGSLLALIALGASDAVSIVIRFSLVQIETPDDKRGRVSAINYLFVGSSNTLGEFESGAVAAWLGMVPSVLIGGSGCYYSPTCAASTASSRRIKRKRGLKCTF